MAEYSRDETARRRPRWWLWAAAVAAGLALAALLSPLVNPTPDKPAAAVVPLPPPAPQATNLTPPVLTPPAPPATAPHLTPPPPQARPKPQPSAAALAALPSWQRYAMPAPPEDGRPRIAIIIDDVGMDRTHTGRAIALKGPVTLAFLAFAPDLAKQTAAARANGHELLLHVPMEAMNATAGMGANALTTEQPDDEVLRRLRWDLDRFSDYVGINNQMGSKFTSEAGPMRIVMGELKARGLLFVDSRTIATTVGARAARDAGVPFAARDVFLDDAGASPDVSARLKQLEELARRKGTAIAIGHPHDTTLAAIQRWLPTLPAKGIVLVPVSAIVKQRDGG